MRFGHILVAYQTVHFSRSSTARTKHAACPKRARREVYRFPIPRQGAERGQIRIFDPMDRPDRAPPGSVTARTASTILEGPSCPRHRPACRAVRPVVSTSSTRTTEIPSRFAKTRLIDRFVNLDRPPAPPRSRSARPNPTCGRPPRCRSRLR